MKIRFANHASFICEHEGVQLLSDPWLFGSAFNDGWDLVAETPLTPEELAGVDYIWISHEHPDHFSPRVLLSIPREQRAGITILYQETNDKKVLRFCSKQGFKARELCPGERVRLAPGFYVECQRVPLYDAWLLIEAPGARVLNLNDAVVHTQRDLEALRQRVGAIDLLATQFSYAAWRGNEADVHMRQKDAARKLDILRRQVSVLGPRYTLPFASFCWFSHEENGFINDACNRPQDAIAAVRESGSTPVLLYPGDTWELGSEHDNASALERWDAAYASLATRERRSSEPVELPALQAAAEAYAERIRAANDTRVLWLLRQNPILPSLRPIDIHLWDLDLDVRFSFEDGLQTIAQRSQGYDLRMGSQSLQFLFKHTWGIDTLTVNGRFYADPGGVKQLVTTFGVDLLNNAGIRLEPKFLVDVPNISFLLGVLLRKLRSLRDQVSA